MKTWPIDPLRNKFARLCKNHHMDVSREQQLQLAAELYYLQDYTMETIGHRLGLSRSSVSRLLKAARQEGLVTIRLNAPAARRLGLAAKIQERFGVEAHVVSLTDDADAYQSLDDVALAAARLLAMWVDSQTILGVAWGTTTTAIARHLQPKSAPGAIVVQLNGAANTRSSGITYAGSIISRFADAFGATVLDFPVPAFFDFAETKNLMWRERSIRRVLDVAARADIALFSVGSLTGPLPSHVYSAGYFEQADLETLRAEGVVGDVCTVLLRRDGSYADIDLNRRASGPNPQQLKLIPRRLCAVAGPAKLAPLLAALRAGVATHLVVDEGLARRLVKAN
ncbi:MAG: transcriptional regulator [Bifidobacteriaceae bacterium]|jgi:DNA-binding transcriptional regulator LsrR (DeoR family)|nr:transcriptional regulator [Bifidobacteriaceae bacterium]